MKKRTIGIVLVLGLCTASVCGAQPTLLPGVNDNGVVAVNPRTFVGGLYFDGALDNTSGTLQATKPICTLTVPNPNPQAGGQGHGPNGGILLDGSPECAGNYELFMSQPNQFGTPPQPFGNNGVYSGTFAIVQLSDQKTAV